MGFTLVPLLYPPSLHAVAPFRLVGEIAVVFNAMQGYVDARDYEGLELFIVKNLMGKA